MQRPSCSLHCRRWVALLMVQAGCALAATPVVAAAPPPATTVPQPPSPARESTVKAAYLYRFGSFVEWPASTFASPTDPLVIGVVGDDFVASDLEQIVAGRTVDSRPVQVVRIREPQSGERVHILYLGNLRTSRLREFVPPPNVPVLLVSERDDAPRLGSALYFGMDGGRIRFSAAPVAAEARGLRLSARLLTVAQHVEGHGR